MTSYRYIMFLSPTSSKTPLGLLFALLITGATQNIVFAQIQARKADDFVNSIGVATHIDRWKGPYSNGQNVKNQLLNLGIKHVRDQIRESGITNYNTVKLLADNGIKSTGFLHGDFNNPSLTPAWWLQQVKNEGAMYAYEAIEGANESDLGFGFVYKGEKWPVGTKAFQIDLYNTVKNDASTKHLHVLGPTIGGGSKKEPAASLGDISAYVDYGNFHYYKTAGQSYSEGAPAWDLKTVMGFHNAMFGTKPYLSTEGGYNTAVATYTGISQTVNAKYTLRFYLEYWRLGVVRTFKYELFDGGVSDSVSEDRFGLIANDGVTLTPAALSVKNMISILKEPDPSMEFAPGTLNFTLSNADNYTHHNLLQKSNGKFYLIIWNDTPSWNISNKLEISNNDPLTLKFNEPIDEAKLYAPCTDGIAVISNTLNPSTLNITVPNHPFIFEITPKSLITEVGEKAEQDEYFIYTNHANNELIVKGNVGEDGKYEISSLDGKILLVGNLSNNPIDISRLFPGLYMIKTRSARIESIHRFVK